MTTYRLMFGINPMAIFVMPLLFDDHPDLLPRFNDAKIKVEDNKYVVEIISRIGKKYHGSGMGEEKYFDHPLFIRFEDKLTAMFQGETFTDNTYGRYYFHLPDEFYNDIRLIYEQKKVVQTSEKFKEKILAMYPKLRDHLLTLFTKGFML